MMDYKKLLIGLGITILSLTLPYLAKDTRLVSLLELKSFDLRAQLNHDKDEAKSKDIVMILIDESSLKSMAPVIGRWPWPRGIYGELFDYLAQSEAKMVLVDILFTETQSAGDNTQGLGIDDQVLVETTATTPGIVHSFQLLHDKGKDTEFLNKTLNKDFQQLFRIAKTNDPHKLINENNNHYYLPFDALWQNSGKLGIVEVKPDFDGIYRRTKLIREYQGNHYPTLSFTAIQKLFPHQEIQVGKKALRLDQMEIPLINKGNYLFKMKLNFESYSAAGVFASIQAIQNGDYENVLIPPEAFKDKIVFIGASAAGTYDLINTSLGPNIPGVFLHASVVENILKKEFYKELPPTLIPIISLLGCLCIVFIILFSGKLWLQIPSLVLIIGLFLGTSIYSFKEYLIWIPIIYPLLSFSFSCLGGYGFLAATEGRAKRKVRKMLSQYVSPNVLTEVMDKSDNVLTAEVGGKENLTVFFSDIRSFTSLSENAEAEQIVEMLNFYLDKMVGVVFEYKGTLDKFIGDAVMAFWGAPVQDPEHATKGVCCALKMVEALKEVNAHFDEKGYPHFKIGMGLNTGPVILGNIGSEKKLDYTVIGDNVNLGSRIEGLTKMYLCDILMSEFTQKELTPDIHCKVVDLVRVKGKKKPIRIYAPLNGLDANPEETKTAIWIKEQYEKAFSLYTEKKFQDAITIYSEIQKKHPEDKLTEVYIDRCNAYLKEPPEDDWDGVNTLTTK